jgi:Transglutaminase-like superfamily
MDSFTLLTRKLHKARAFSAQDWWILSQAWLLLLAVDWGLRLLPFRRLHLLLVHRQGRPAPDPASLMATIQRVQELVDIAARNHLYPMHCLRRSLVLQRLLAERGIITDLRFGVQRDAGTTHAHAWLEHAGQAIGEPHDVTSRFVPLVSMQKD